ncbi:MAG TPA: MFS transporter [Candidatus Brachybacterium merdavium]|uniref:MFS transporter n=1 Tax=Candidatus Brachybacterium merdavium TaxID=2838513 RepID=A0A9D2LCM7_9MICO|nr:MFS transporter [Candidatus Brachybacterium merdavium]
MTASAPPPAERSPRTTSQVIRSLAPSVYIPSLLEFTGQAALMPVIPLLALQLGFSVPQAAALTTIFGIASFLGPIPAGRLISRVGARPALVTTGSLLVVANLVAFTVISHGLEAGAGLAHQLTLVGLLTMMAASAQVWMLGRQSYLGTALPPAMRARGMTMFGGVIRIGQVAGPLLGALVLALGHDTGVFVLYAVTACGATVMVATFLPAGELRGGRSAPRGRRPRPSQARTRLTRAVLSRMVMVGVGIAPVMISRVNRPVIIPLLGASLGLESMWVSIVFGVSAVIEILLVIPAGTLMDRYGRVAVAVPCALVNGAGYLLLAVMTQALAGDGVTAAVVALLVPSMVIAVGNGLGSGIVMTLGIDVSPVHDRTRYLAWWNTLMGAGRLTAPLLVTGITVVAPVAVAGAVTGALCVAGGAWLARALPRLTPSGSTRGR